MLECIGTIRRSIGEPRLSALAYSLPHVTSHLVRNCPTDPLSLSSERSGNGPSTAEACLRYPRFRRITAIHPLLLLTFVFFGLGFGIRAQSVTQIENFGTASASQVRNGLGFNIDPTHEWEFQIAEQLGGSYVRFDCSWPTVEKQNQDNTSGGFSLPPRCAEGLKFAREYKQHPSINALYGPPSHLILTATVASDTPAGSTGLILKPVTGSLASARPFYSHIQLAGGKQFVSKWSYPGGMVVAIDAARGRIELASATTTPLAANTSVQINELLYPPVLLKKTDNFMTNPSILAYARYARFLATSIQQAGVVGQVGLWNEPIWAHDRWDIGNALYDNAPTDLGGFSPRVEIPLYLSSTAPMNGVVYDSEYTNKTGGGSIYFPARIALMPSLGNALKTVPIESFHPYGFAPEDHFWYPECVVNLVNNSRAANLVSSQCSPLGANPGSNFKLAALFGKMPAAHGGPSHNITETGACRQCSPGTTEEKVTRFDMRQFIGFQGMGVSPIMFYRLADPNKNNYGWIDYESHQGLPVFNAVKALMADVESINGSSSSASTCPAILVASYTGYYPLATVSFVGNCAATGPGSGMMFFTWQRSYSTIPSTNSDNQWIDLPSPRAVPVKLTIPNGMRVVAVKNVVTTKPVAFNVKNNEVTYGVTDDPIGVFLQRATN